MTSIKHTSIKHSQLEKASARIFVIVTIASVVVSISLVIMNILWSTIKYNSKVQGLQEDTRATLVANIESIKGLKNSFSNLEVAPSLIPNQANTKKNSEVILDALPSKYDFPGLASSIDSLARVSSVELTSFRGTDLGSEALQSSPSPTPIQIPFSVEVSGNYEAISKFLKGIEDSIRPFKVTTLTIAGTASKLKVNLSLETSYQPAFDLNVQKRTIQ